MKTRKGNTSNQDKKVLRDAGFRMTGHTRFLLETLRQSAVPVTVQAIFDQTMKRGWDLGTVYRLLVRLEHAGLVRSTSFGTRARWFEAVSEGSHHHHMFCTQCGRIERLDSCALGILQPQAEKRHGFQVSSHSMELFGRCHECRNSRLPQGGKAYQAK